MKIKYIIHCFNAHSKTTVFWKQLNPKMRECDNTIYDCIYTGNFCAGLFFNSFISNNKQMNGYTHVPNICIVAKSLFRFSVDDVEFRTLMYYYFSNCYHFDMNIMSCLIGLRILSKYIEMKKGGRRCTTCSLYYMISWKFRSFEEPMKILRKSKSMISWYIGKRKEHHKRIHVHRVANI